MAAISALSKCSSLPMPSLASGSHSTDKFRGRQEKQQQQPRKKNNLSLMQPIGQNIANKFLFASSYSARGPEMRPRAMSGKVWGKGKLNFHELFCHYECGFFFIEISLGCY